METNNELRTKMRAYGISQWMVADAIGVSENTINRWMRHELAPEKKKKILDAIEKCKQNQKEETEA